MRLLAKVFSVDPASIINLKIINTCHSMTIFRYSKDNDLFLNVIYITKIQGHTILVGCVLFLPIQLNLRFIFFLI